MSHAAWFETFKAEILAQPGAPRVEVIDEPGSTYNQLGNGAAAVADAIEFWVQTIVEGLYLDTASGDALSRLGADRYSVVRHGATSALVSLSLERPTYGAGAIVLDEGSIARHPSGVRFALAQRVSFGATALGPVAVRAYAVSPGLEGNVAAASGWEWETSVDDTTITIESAEAAAGGGPEEDDEPYRGRVRAAFVTARRATLEAIRQGALTVPQVREAAAYEVLDPEGRPAGAVVLTLADAEGGANAEMVADVNEAMVEYRAAGVGVFPQVATVRLESIQLRITWRPGQATPANALAARQVVVGAVNRLPPRAAPSGATCEAAALLTVGLIQAAARSVAGVVDVEVVVPVGTVVPDPGECVRTELGLVEVVA